MHVKQLFDLSGKVAIVTGGSRGIGLQIAEGLGEAGARLAITARKADELEESRASLTARGFEVMAVTSDVGKPDGPATMVGAVMAHYGQVDILVNNAGATWGAPAEDYPLDAWQKVINVNLSGVFLASQACAKLSMIPRRSGRIITISSVAGLRGNVPGRMETVAYNTTKAGQINLTRTLAAEWGKYGINVNSIAPGFFPTRMVAGSPQIVETARERTLVGRVGNDDDLKGVVVLLGSDAGSFITGQTISVDGGISAY